MLRLRATSTTNRRNADGGNARTKPTQTFTEKVRWIMRSPTAEKLKERLKEFETPRQRMAFMQTPEGLHYVEALLNEGVQPRAIFMTHFGVESRSMSRLRKHNPEVAKIITQYNQRLKKAYIEKMATPDGLAKVRDLSAKGYSLKAICEQHFNLNYPQHVESNC